MMAFDWVQELYPRIWRLCPLQLPSQFRSCLTLARLLQLAKMSIRTNLLAFEFFSITSQYATRYGTTVYRQLCSAQLAWPHLRALMRFKSFCIFLNELDGKRSWEGEGKGGGGGEGEMMSERENSPGVVPIWFRRTYLSLLNVQASSISQSSCVSPVKLPDGSGRRRRGRSQIIRRRENLVL